MAMAYGVVSTIKREDNDEDMKPLYHVLGSAYGSRAGTVIQIHRMNYALFGPLVHFGSTPEAFKEQATV